MLNRWRPQGDLNPCYRRESAMATRRRPSISVGCLGTKERKLPSKTPHGISNGISTTTEDDDEDTLRQIEQNARSGIRRVRAKIADIEVLGDHDEELPELYEAEHLLLGSWMFARERLVRLPAKGEQ